MALTQEEIRVLDLLYQDARITPERAAVMLGMTEQAVTEAIRHLEEERVIVGYPALINWDKTPIEKVKAVIEVKVTPQRDRGFDAIAERIYARHRWLTKFLVTLGVSEKTAAIDACKMEHDLSDETFECIKAHALASNREVAKAAETKESGA